MRRLCVPRIGDCLEFFKGILVKTVAIVVLGHLLGRMSQKCLCEWATEFFADFRASSVPGLVECELGQSVLVDGSLDFSAIFVRIDRIADPVPKNRLGRIVVFRQVFLEHSLQLLAENAWFFISSPSGFVVFRGEKPCLVFPLKIDVAGSETASLAGSQPRPILYPQNVGIHLCQERQDGFDVLTRHGTSFRVFPTPFVPLFEVRYPRQSENLGISGESDEECPVGNLPDFVNLAVDVSAGIQASQPVLEIVDVFSDDIGIGGVREKFGEPGVSLPDTVLRPPFRFMVEKELVDVLVDGNRAIRHVLPFNGIRGHDFVDIIRGCKRLLHRCHFSMTAAILNGSIGSVKGAVQRFFFVALYA